MTAWAYLAVSSNKQSETLADQEGWAQHVAAENGWEITRTFSAVSSGAHGVRKLLEQLLVELRTTSKARRPTRVLMIRLDRLGRGEGIEAVAALAEIRRLGVMIHTRQDGDVLIERASDAILPMLRSITGALENESRADKSRAMHARKKSAGEVQGLPPYGFVIENRHLAVDELEAAYIRRLFELRAGGYSAGKLAQDARERAPGKRRQNGQRTPQRWWPSALLRMLRNPVYRDRIVSPALFLAVQARRRSVIRRGGRNPWPLIRSLQCVCGLHMTGKISGTDKYRTRYYVCPDPATHDGYPGHRATDLEHQFAALLALLKSDPSLIAGYEPPSADLDALAARKMEIDREIAALDDRRRKAWALAEDGGIDGAELRARIDELHATRERLQASATRIVDELSAASELARNHAEICDVLGGAAEAWERSEVEVRQRIAMAVAALVGGIYVDPDRRHVLNVGPAPGEFGRKVEAFRSISPWMLLRERLAAVEASGAAR